MSEDYLAQQPTAIWNSARGAWEIPATENLLCAHLELFSQTWPTSGMTQNGLVFEQPTQVRLTTDSESLSSPIPDDSMLRTPSAIEGEGGAISENQARERNRMLQVRDQMAQLAAENGLKVSKGIANGLLPTPAVNDMGGNKTVEWWDEWTEKTRLKFNNSNGHGPSLNIEMLKLMPTPNTMDSLPPRSPEKIAESKIRTPGGYANVRETVVNELLRTPVAQEGTKAPSQQDAETKAKTGQVWLSNEAKGLANENIGWGKFEPAIRRWEQVLGRPAPAPTKPDGKDDAHRLSSKFTEWMMGLPDGWITDCGLSRNEELKAAGNGVVPQQAELALRLLLEGVDWQGGE